MNILITISILLAIICIIELITIVRSYFIILSYEKFIEEIIKILNNIKENEKD